MKKIKKYWKSSEELKKDSKILNEFKNKEFVQKLPEDIFDTNKQALEDSSTNRRDFLKYVGFSTAAAGIAACEGPVINSVPYVVQPDEIIPGNANYYASSIADGYDYRNILVKTREGRPIKIKQNKDAISLGECNARVLASVLSLYDSKRLKGPKVNGLDIDWDDFDQKIVSKLKNLYKQDKRVVLLTHTIPSPTTQKIINKFISKFPNIKHVVYDSISSSETLDAFESSFGIRAFADYDFSKAETIVSIDADFLGDWQGGGYEGGYSKGRVPKGNKGKSSMSYHVQFESNMSLTGANADKRIPCRQEIMKKIVLEIHSKIFDSGFNTHKGFSELDEKFNSIISDVTKRLIKSGKKSLVVSGIQNVEIQKMILEINQKLSSDAFDIENPKIIHQGKNSDVKDLVDGILDGSIKGILTFGIDPGYTLPMGIDFVKALQEVDLSVVFSMKENETSAGAEYIAAVPHYLESWGDYEFKLGHYSLAQPTIQPLFNTRQFQDILLKWSGDNSSYYSEIKKNWNENILKGKSWNKSLHDGVYISNKKFNPKRDKIAFKYNLFNTLNSSNDDSIDLILYTKIGMGDGNQANNPWLQEFPDPISRTTWDNYLTVSIKDAKKFGFKNYNVANGGLNGSYAKIEAAGKEIIAPVLIQPGQAEGTMGLAFGYGKVQGMKEEMQIGVNAFKLYENFEKIQSAKVSLLENKYHEFACIQLHNTLMGRGDIIKETTLEIFNTKDKSYWNPIPVVSKNHIEIPVNSDEVDMWDSFDRSIGHHFNMSIDLNACTGCGACIIACHSENNVPVVGKREVRKSRDMHWLRIDRYYSSEQSFESDNETVDAISGLGETLTVMDEMENANENPEVSFQPIMCQHCNHAPCETVCPVAATSHGRQGQNHMAYNRCVGTRYCANNCPYKVRRFNWFRYNKNDEFDYNMNDDLGRMVLNPDVVVRSRGVMEKCSMCIQMTQKTILDAKIEGREIKDGDFGCACSKACGSGAIVFGDINDSKSEIKKLKDNDRAYHLLESVGTKPNVIYQTKIRNKDIS